MALSRVDRARPLLDLIGRHESDGAAKAQGVDSPYKVVWGGIRKEDRPRNLTAITVARVLWWQDTIDPLYRSEAAGRYQIMEDTLRTLKFRPAAKFDEATQDALALQLLDRRGWAEVEAGRMTPESFGNGLAKEWASLPVMTGPNRGESYYKGDGLNQAHATPEEVLEAIHAAMGGPEVPTLEDRIAALEADVKALRDEAHFTGLRRMKPAAHPRAALTRRKANERSA